MVIDPILVALGSVAWIEDDVAASVIQAGLVPPDLALFGQHPVLKSENKLRTTSWQTWPKKTPTNMKWKKIALNIWTPLSIKSPKQPDGTLVRLRYPGDDWIFKIWMQLRQLFHWRTWLPPWLWHGHNPTGLCISSVLTGESTHCRLQEFRIWTREGGQGHD